MSVPPSVLYFPGGAVGCTDVGMVCAVSFTRYGRLYYLDAGGHSPSVGDKVLVPTDDGPEVAECVWAPQWVSEDTGGFPVLAGMADDGAHRAGRAAAAA